MGLLWRDTHPNRWRQPGSPSSLEFLRRPESRQGDLTYFCVSVSSETDSVTSKINHQYGTTGNPDLANQTYWNTVWWTNMLQPWFDTVPSGNWFRINGRPVIYIWSVSFFSNVVGHEVPLLNYLEAQFKATYGQDPVFILDKSWFGDPCAWQMIPQ